MLVLTRKKNESLLLDGRIRIEVVTLSRAAVRLRLTAPRSLHLARAADRRVQRSRPDSSRDEDLLGVEVIHATLVNQQFLPLGANITLGVLDADQTRVLLFVEAPQGMCIATAEPEPPRPKRQASEQNLLQFMKPGTERTEPPPEPAAPAPSPPEVLPRVVEPAPRLLPFPQVAKRQAGR